MNKIICENIEKVTQFIDFNKKNKIDLVMLIEINSKQIMITKDKMASRLNKLGRGRQVIFANSKAHQITESDQLQGGLMNIIIEKLLIVF